MLNSHDVATKNPVPLSLLVGLILLLSCAPTSVPEGSQSHDRMLPSKAIENSAITDPSLQIEANESKTTASNDAPVSIRLGVLKKAFVPGEQVDVKVTMIIPPGFEIYALNATSPKFPTQIQLALPSGWATVSDWSGPRSARSFNSAGGGVYRGEALFQQTLHIPESVEIGDYTIDCSVQYQACDANICLRPTETSLKLLVSVIHPK